MNEELQVQIDRVAGVADRLEVLLSQHSLMAAEGEATIGKIVAMVGASNEGREAELSERLAQAERMIAELRASASVEASHSARRTLPVTLLAKQEGAIETGALDAALSSLSLEQRIAVKAQLLRAGLV